MRNDTKTKLSSLRQKQFLSNDQKFCSDGEVFFSKSGGRWRHLAFFGKGKEVKTTTKQMSLDKSSREHQTTSQLEMIGERKHSAFLQQRKKALSQRIEY